MCARTVPAYTVGMSGSGRTFEEIAALATAVAEARAAVAAGEVVPHAVGANG
jgi:hypothetical protein